MNRSYIARNAAARARVETLIERSSDADLTLPLENGWTVAAVLAHLAFWDRVRLRGWELFVQSGGAKQFFRLGEVGDMINDGALPQWRALSPREAVRQVLDAVEAVDHKIETLSLELVESYLAENEEWPMLDRAAHRERHLDDIERILSIQHHRQLPGGT